MTSTSIPTPTSTSTPASAAALRGSPRRRLRPWWRWLLSALAFPPAGLLGHVVAGRIDSLPSAILGGAVTGAGIGAVQWALLRRRGVGYRWIVATAVGLAVGLAVGAPLVSYRTDLASLALMGAACGLGVGVGQGVTLGDPARRMLWSVATAALWALGWTVTTVGGIDVDQQWVVFGAYGAIALAFLQSFLVGAFVPAVADPADS